MANTTTNPDTTSVSVISMSRHSAVNACSIFDQRGLVVKRSATDDQLVQLGTNISGFREKVGNAFRWWAGDLALAAETRGEESYSRVADAVGLTLRDIQNCATVSKKIALDERVEGLSWSAHRAVTSIPDTHARRKLLDQAKKDGLSSRQIEALVRAWKIENGLDKGDKESAGDTVPSETVTPQIAGATLYDVIAFIKRSTTSDLERIGAAVRARGEAIDESLGDDDSDSAVDDALAAFEKAIKAEKGKK